MTTASSSSRAGALTTPKFFQGDFDLDEVFKDLKTPYAFPHGLGANPDSVQFSLVAQKAVYGYQVGEEVPILEWLYSSYTFDQSNIYFVHSSSVTNQFDARAKKTTLIEWFALCKNNICDTSSTTGRTSDWKLRIRAMRYH